ncbi:MAG: lipid-A-disaccharide synthase [Alphaproteobacteria bacterium]|nr:lipid-A-disaccharide synthase [Alphaproteobacteria bacterium]
MTESLFLIAGEPSGDSLGAGLIAALQARAPGRFAFWGIGGDLMKKKGFHSLLPMEEITIMGLWEVVSQLPRLVRLMRALAEEIEKRNPAAVITIDFQEFNYHLARTLKKRGKYKGKIIQYVAPTVWAWRPGRARKIAKVFDRLLCLFPFEPPYFQKHGLKTVHIGHPIVEQDPMLVDRQAFRDLHGVGEDETLLGVFLGSREHELKISAQVFQETLSILREQWGDVRILVPTIPALEYNVRAIIESWGGNPILVSDPTQKWEAFAACDLAMAVSGTVGLELAYFGVPHVIAYRMNPLSWEIAKRIVKIPYAHLANILLNEKIVPEYLQGHCDSLKVGAGISRLFKNPDARAKQKEKFKALPGLLAGADGENPSVTAAEEILSCLAGL